MTDGRESNNFYLSGEESDGDIPNEFSDNEEMNSQGRDSHHFAPRASVSSQGSRRDPTQVVNQQRPSEPEDSREIDRSERFEEGGAESYAPSQDGGDSSVVEEIVEQRVVNLKSDEEDNAQDEEEENNDFRQNYLDVDGEDYINREEYGSDVQQEESGIDEIREAGFHTNFNEEEGAHELTIQREWEDSYQYEQRKFQIMENGEIMEEENRGAYQQTPINEDEEHGEETEVSREYPADADLVKISQEVKKKDQSRKLVLWEKSQMRNQWEDTMASSSKQEAAIKKNSNKWDLPNKTRPQDIAQPKKTDAHFENISSKVPAITDYPEARTRKAAVRPLDNEDPLHQVPKTDRHLTNIFYQSSLQRQLQNGRGVNKDHPPTTHASLEKKLRAGNKNEGRPIFGAPSARGHEGAVDSGRARMFYSSQVF